MGEMQNNKNAKVKWQFTTEDARIKLPDFIRLLKVDVTLRIIFQSTQGVHNLRLIRHKYFLIKYIAKR